MVPPQRVSLDHVDLRAGQNKPETWEVDFGLTDLPYNIPNICLETGEAAAHVRVGWKRSVQNIFHAFAINSFVDELAEAAGREDRVEYLLELSGRRVKSILTKSGVTDYFNYDNSVELYPIDTGRLSNVREARGGQRRAGTGEPGERRGMGLAAHRSFLDLCRDNHRGRGCAGRDSHRSRAW